MNHTKLFFLLIIALLLFSCSEDTIDDNQLGTLTGKAVTEGENLPIANVKISTNPSSSIVFTDEEGNFIIENIEAGEYSVQAQKDSLLVQFEAVTIVPGATANVVFEMQPQDILNELPLAPQPLQPQDNEEEVSTNVTFIWNSSETDDDEILYTLEIHNNQNDEVLLFEEIVDTSFTVENLNYNTTYFWQVGAKDEVAPPVWSEIFSFETMAFPQARILFTRLIDGNNVIFALDEEGNEIQLTPEDKNSFRPRKNNITNKIAFLRTINGQTHLFTMNPDGSEVFQVTSAIPVTGFNTNVLDYSWAENGSSFLFPNFDKLFEISATGEGTTLVYETPNGNFISEVDVSEDDNKIAIITNNSIGYDAAIQILDGNGNLTETVISGLPGALGGLDLSVDGQQLLFTRDISGYESFDYRQLDSRMFIHNFTTGISTDISEGKAPGTNDLDPRFSPNEAMVIFTNTSNDGISEKDILKSGITINQNDRNIVEENASMPDWE